MALKSGHCIEVHNVLSQWIKHYGYTGRVEEIRNRQALLEYDRNPPKSLAYINDRLGLRFQHQKQVLDRQLTTRQL